MTVINQVGKNTDTSAKDVALEAKTMVLTETMEGTLGPRLVCTTPTGSSQIFPLNKEKLVIGRSVEADLNLLDPLVSRKHCVVEKRADGYVVRNVSTTNPLFLNDRPITEKRLYAGDQVKIGSVSLAFISDRAKDARKIDTKLLTKNKRMGWGLWFSVFLLLSFAAYFAYFNAYTPLKIKWTLSTLSKQVKLGKYQSAQKKLKHLLNLNLLPIHEHQAMELLTESTWAIAQNRVQEQRLEDGIDYLLDYLEDYGARKESDVLWDRLDYFRLTLGQRLEKNKQNQPALGQYAAIREDSIYFEEAQKAIRRIWLASQQPRQDQTLTQLLKEAETHFLANRFLKPVNQNAYTVYQAVLSIDPEHPLALKRLDQMKAFYREKGDAYFTKKKWSKALSFYERYYLIDTEVPEINDKIKLCREKLSKSRSSHSASDKKKTIAASNEQDEKRAEVKRLLEESGNESSWIMKYLFEEQEKNSDKPW
ncbi:MAG: FHA domain-containing protein [Desulfobacterales bacterium]|jgi:pSer/pThr/pTyr-binding forkhead associated (FHA) protein